MSISLLPLNWVGSPLSRAKTTKAANRLPIIASLIRFAVLSWGRVGGGDSAAALGLVGGSFLMWRIRNAAAMTAITARTAPVTCTVRRRPGRRCGTSWCGACPGVRTD
jgi:hypothetical protein